MLEKMDNNHIMWKTFLNSRIGDGQGHQFLRLLDTLFEKNINNYSSNSSDAYIFGGQPVAQLVGRVSHAWSKVFTQWFHSGPFIACHSSAALATRGDKTVPKINIIFPVH